MSTWVEVVDLSGFVVDVLDKDDACFYLKLEDRCRQCGSCSLLKVLRGGYTIRPREYGPLDPRYTVIGWDLSNKPIDDLETLYTACLKQHH